MKNLRNMVFAIGLFLVASFALAQGMSQRSFTKDDVAGFKGDDKSLTKAIEAIEEGTDGRVIEIRYTAVKGEPGYHAVIASSGQVQFVHIQEKSQDVVEIDAADSPDWMLGWQGRSIVKVAEKAHVSLADAVRTAEKSGNGAPAVAAGFSPSASDPDSAVHAYNVLLYTDGDIQRKAVDSDDGMIIGDPSALTED